MFKHIFQFTKSYFLMLIVMSIVGVGMFAACNKKSKIDSVPPIIEPPVEYFTLKITKTGTGSVSASWSNTTSYGYSYGQATDEALTTGVKIPKGTKGTLRATPSSDNGYVLWNNTNKSNTYEFTMDKDKSIAVNIVAQYLLSVNKTGKGSISASWKSGSATDAQLSAGVWIDENTEVTFTATPDPTMPNVIWNNNVTGNTFSFTFTNYSYVSVDFTATPPTFYALNITQPLISDGVIYAYSNAERTMPIYDLSKILKDAKVYIKVVPATGKKITQLLGVDVGSANSDNTEAVVTMTSPKQISASFETITYSLTLTPATNGTIQAFTNNARTIPVADLTKIPYNTIVYLKIIPNTDYVVSALSGIDAGSANSDNTQATITMAANKTISASFIYNFSTLTITPTTNGTIQAYTDNALTMPANLTKIQNNTKIYLKITPNTNYIVSALSGIDAGSANTDKTRATVTMTANKTISATIDFDYTGFVFTETATTATLKQYTGALTSVTIPSTYHGKPVTVIANGGTAVFSESVTDVIIPNSVTSIGNNAFRACTGLTNVTISINVTNIGNDAFHYCSGLKSITIPNGVMSIGDWAFGNCTKLTSVTIPNTVTSIGEYAFAGTGLTSVTIPNSVMSIGSAAFADCKGLTNINVNTTNANYSSNNGILFNKTQTTLVEYPSGKTGVAYSIPNNVTSIGEMAFGYCRGLTNITIGSSVTSIGDEAFFYCIGLFTITMQSTTPPNVGSYIFNATLSSLQIRVPNASINVYKAATGWSGYSERIYSY